MDRLRAELHARLDQLPNADAIRLRIATDVGCHPLSDVDLLVAFLMSQGLLALDEYLEMRDDAIKRNPYLHLYEITAPRDFGEGWAQSHLQGLVPSLKRPSTSSDDDFEGQYDLWEEDSLTRVEVKATRVVEDGVKGRLSSKALRTTDEKSYTLYFKQIKPDCTDVFVLIAVFIDEIRYWVIPACEMDNLPSYCDKLHRKAQGSGQLQLRSTVLPLIEKFRVAPDDLKTAIKEARDSCLVGTR